MNARQTDEQQYSAVLEACLREMAAGTTIEALLERYPEHSLRLRADLATARWLSDQKPLFNPPAHFLIRSRNTLLHQIRSDQKQRAGKQAPVRPSLAGRSGWTVLLGWLRGNRLVFQALSALLIVVLLVGSFSGVAFASQASLPGESLYPVKTTVEDLRLLVVQDPVSDASLNLDFAGSRMDEMAQLVDRNQPEHLAVPANRYEQQVDAALVDLSGLTASSEPRQLQRAQLLARGLPELLGTHAASLSLLAEKTSGAGQAALQHTHQFAQQRQVASRQLVANLDRLSSFVLTSTPTEEDALRGLQQPTESTSGSQGSVTATFFFTGTPTLTLPAAFHTATVFSPSAGTATGTPFGFTASPTLTKQPTATSGFPSDTPSSPTDPPKPPTSTPQPTNTQPPPPTATDEPAVEPTKKPSNTPRPTNTHRPTPLPTNPNRP